MLGPSMVTGYRGPKCDKFEGSELLGYLYVMGNIISTLPAVIATLSGFSMTDAGCRRKIWED